MSSFVSEFQKSLDKSGIDYRILENVKDFRDKNDLLEVSGFSGKTFSIEKTSIGIIPEVRSEIGVYFEKLITDVLKLKEDSFDLRISKDYVGEGIFNRLKEECRWKSWFMLSSKYLNRSFQGYIFLTISKENLYFVVFDGEDLKRFVSRKKIASNDRYHFYFGEANSWKLF